MWWSSEAAILCVRDDRLSVRPGPLLPTRRPKKNQSSSRHAACEAKPAAAEFELQKACLPGFSGMTT